CFLGSDLQCRNSGQNGHSKVSGVGEEPPNASVQLEGITGTTAEKLTPRELDYQVFGSARSRPLLPRTGAPPPPSSEVPEVAKLQSGRRWPSSLPAPRGLPAPSSPQALAVDFSDPRCFHFGGRRGTGEALTVSAETRLDCRGTPGAGGYFARCGRAAPGCVCDAPARELRPSGAASAVLLPSAPPEPGTPRRRQTWRTRAPQHSPPQSRAPSEQSSGEGCRAPKPWIGPGAGGRGGGVKGKPSGARRFLKTREDAQTHFPGWIRNRCLAMDPCVWIALPRGLESASINLPPGTSQGHERVL
ncbi:uncharacterized protein LOC120227254, partial [Hyaena hyaena]|uniref:uncharacterized protein LOC120227254 n=1 Tax=Hyaena hyaena TaxID=95912 RepID=UPI001924C204